MLISGNVPEHLIIGARTGFLTALKMPEMAWARVATTLDMTTRSLDLVDLGAAPMPVEDKGGQQMQSFIEKTIAVKARSWSLKVGISYNAVNDDQTGGLENRVKGAAVNFQKHLNNRVFQIMDAGDGATYGLAYDGQYLFDTDHVDKGAAYSTNQSNVNALTLSLDNFETVNTYAQKYYDDQGEFSNYAGDLLVVPPNLERIAANITGNNEDYATGNRAINPFSGKKDYIVSPQLGTAAWFLVDTKEPTKPFIVAMREQPNLQATGFDSDATDGGLYWFKFYARYEVYPGDWRLITMGHT